MIARAALCVDRAIGRSRVTQIRSDPPLTLRETPTGVHLVGSGAGPVGGDDLALSVRLGDGADLVLRSVAASMVHPGPTARPSFVAVDATVGSDASLVWNPQPSILVRGSDHHVTTRLRVGERSSVVWREELVLGRHGEESGSVLLRLVVDGPDGPLLRNDLALGPRWPGSLGPGGSGAARAVGTMLVLGVASLDLVGRITTAAPRPGLRWAASPLAGERGVLVTAVAATAPALCASFDDLVDQLERIPVTHLPTARGGRQ